MIAAIRNLPRRLHNALRTAVQVSRAARYTALNGPLAAQLADGRLIQASTFLRTLGLNEQGVRSFRSHFGKKVKAAHIAATGQQPLMAWCLIDERWTRVCVYQAANPALPAGVQAYPRLAAVVNDSCVEAA